MGLLEGKTYTQFPTEWISKDSEVLGIDEPSVLSAGGGRGLSTQI